MATLLFPLQKGSECYFCEVELGDHFKNGVSFLLQYLHHCNISLLGSGSSNNYYKVGVEEEAPIWGISGHTYFLEAPQIILKELPPNEN